MARNNKKTSDPGNRTGPDVFARHIVRPEPLYAEVIEAGERIGAHGEVIEPLDAAALAAALAAARSRGHRAVAIVFMHGYRYPQHEAQAAGIARAAGFETIATSHAASPLVRFVARGDTTVFDAYLAPPLADYVGQVASAARDLDRDAQLLLMQHTCHWFCRSKSTASVRMQVRHQTSYAQLLAAVSPQTRQAYLAVLASH